MITKSVFKYYLQCSSYFWFKIHHPEVLTEASLSDFEQMLADQGKVVEDEVYKLFPEIARVNAKGIESVAETKALIANGNRYIGQAGFATADFFAQTDIAHVKDDGHIDMYEIKSSSSMQNMGHEDAPETNSKEKHINDLAFQYLVAIAAGYVVDTLYLVELNKEYHLQGDLDHQALFILADVTKEVHKIATGMQQQMNTALNVLQDSIQPTTCGCRYLPRKKQCPAFVYLHTECAAYAVYDLARIGNSLKRLRQMIDEGIYLIDHIPDSYDLLDTHRDQVHTWKRNEVISRTAEIVNEFNGLRYPLYFLDYETTSTAIPVYEGIKPYQHVPFQYSLHIITAPGEETQHVEYLHCDRTNPMHAVSQHLRDHISDTGTVIVWNKKFESKCNQNMAGIVAGLAPFLHGLNARMYDLMDIFARRYYVHKDFRGSSSIKKVLPVMVPELSYNGLPIANGGTATTQWKRMVFEMQDEAEREELKQQLYAYCKLDTLAMVEVYRKLVEIVNSQSM